MVAKEDRNGNGVLDPGEDFELDRRLDVVEPIIEQSGKVMRFEDIDGDGKWDGENVESVFVARFRDGEWPVTALVFSHKQLPILRELLSGE